MTINFLPVTDAWAVAVSALKLAQLSLFDRSQRVI
jgi:hypothetical protein